MEEEIELTYDLLVKMGCDLAKYYHPYNPKRKDPDSDTCFICGNICEYGFYFCDYHHGYILLKMDRYRNNPELPKHEPAIPSARNIRMAALPNTLTDREWHETLIDFDNRCAYCGKKNSRLHQDHFIPVILGGGKVKENIIPACMEDNLSKCGSHPRDWLIDQYGEETGSQKYQDLVDYLESK